MRRIVRLLSKKCKRTLSRTKRPVKSHLTMKSVADCSPYSCALHDIGCCTIARRQAKGCGCSQADSMVIQLVPRHRTVARREEWWSG